MMHTNTMLGHCFYSHIHENFLNEKENEEERTLNGLTYVEMCRDRFIFRFSCQRKWDLDPILK